MGVGKGTEKPLEAAAAAAAAAIERGEGEEDPFRISLLLPFPLLQGYRGDRKTGEKEDEEEGPLFSFLR